MCHSDAVECSITLTPEGKAFVGLKMAGLLTCFMRGGLLILVQDNG